MKDDNLLMEAINKLLPLIYYSQIHTVTGVRAAEFPTHKEAIKDAQQFVHKHAKVKNGVYVLKEEIDDLKDIRFGQEQ